LVEDSNSIKLFSVFLKSLMTQPPEPNDFSQRPSDDFSQPSVANQSKSSTVLIWVFASLGCGCFGIIIIGILAAIALPSFLSQANKAKQSEAKTYIGSMNRAQQAYRLEHPKFANSLEELKVGIQPETENYRYQIIPQSDPSKSVIMMAQAKKSGLKSYSGAVLTLKKGTKETTVAGVCESDRPTPIPPAFPDTPTSDQEGVLCPPGSKLLFR
jgi:type II secretory pathway pseudopilin PulG